MSDAQPAIFERTEKHAFWLHHWGPADAATAVVPIHGATSHGGWFASLGRELAKRGIATYAPDRRGSGQLRSMGLPESIDVWLDDLAAAVRAVRKRAERVVLLPWCFGAKLAVPTLARGLPVDRTVMLMPAFFFTENAKRRRQAAVGAELEEFPSDLPVEDFVESEHAAAFVEADPWRWRTISRAFARLSGQLRDESRRLISALDGDLTAVFASRDLLVDNASSRELVAAQGIPTVDVDGSHGFFLDDPQRAGRRIADLIE